MILLAFLLFGFFMPVFILSQLNTLIYSFEEWIEDERMLVLSQNLEEISEKYSWDELWRELQDPLSVPISGESETRVNRVFARVDSQGYFLIKRMFHNPKIEGLTRDSQKIVSFEMPFKTISASHRFLKTFIKNLRRSDLKRNNFTENLQDFSHYQMSISPAECFTLKDLHRLESQGKKSKKAVRSS